ncbi:MAG TPA: nuclear transport factor 2 family protein [Solirubrobacteraceae bacterium]|nr:nuclear transport factor 2 family protein [Solirubrobacteraceae bacterium]
MSQENVEIVVTLMQDFNERKPWWELVDERIKWHSRPDEPDATIHHGRKAVRDYIDGWDEMFPGYRIEPDGLPVDLGERVIFPARLVGVARTTGLAVSEPYVFVCTVSESKIVLAREFGTEAEALKAVGLPE